MPDSNNWRRGISTRRNFIKSGAVGGAALLAGCSGGGDEPTPGTDGENGGNTNGKRFRVFDPLTSGATPSERHFNPWNPTQTGCWHPGACVFDRLAVYSPTQNEAYPLMAESWKMPDDKTLEATFSDKWTWHNGDKFVAQDWVMQQEIELAIQKASDEGGKPLVKSVKAVDDYHVRINLNDPLSEIFAVQNTIGIYNGNLARGVFTKHDDPKWSKWHKKLTTGSESEKKAAIEDITTAKYPMITDDPIGHGPFKIKDVGDNIIVMEKYEDHPNADNINFDEFTLKLFSTNQPIQPYSAGKIDATHKGFPVENDLKSKLPKENKLFREGRSSNKLFSFNCGHGVDYESPVNNVNVRKAICHVYSRKQTESLLQGVNRTFDWAPCRVPGKVLSRGKDETAEWVKKFTKYGENDTKRAAELLRREGYEKSNGKWMTPDGKRFKLTIMNGTDRQDIQVLKQNLKDFGIDTTQEKVDDATFDDRRNKGKYDIMPDGSSSNGITAMWATDLVIDWLQSILHFAPESDIPMPIGDPEGSSGTKTINIEQHIRKWQSTGDSKYHHELMWWWNQTLPEAEMLYQPDAGAYNGAHWQLDVKPGIKNGVDDALYIAPKMADGSLKYKG